MSPLMTLCHGRFAHQVSLGAPKVSLARSGSLRESHDCQGFNELQEPYEPYSDLEKMINILLLIYRDGRSEAPKAHRLTPHFH